MDDLFTDIPEPEPAEDFPPESSSEFPPESLPEQEPVEVPGQLPGEENSVDSSSDVSDDTAVPSGEEAPEGMEEVPNPDAVTLEDYLDNYTELYIQQNESLEALLLETKAVHLELKEVHQELINIQQVFPVYAVSFGIVIGLLLLSVLVSYFRP